VGLQVIPQPGANYIKIADEFYRRLADIQKSEKGDFEITTLIDQTKNVRRSIKEVEETLLISFSLVVLVIFFFFRNWLIAIRPLIDIPISLVFTFFIMYVAGFSINVLTLLAVVLATGLVVDDGIVVTENIFRKLEGGLPIRRAALEGSKEIFFAVISTSITLAVVFLARDLPAGFCRQPVPRIRRGGGRRCIGFRFCIAYHNACIERVPEPRYGSWKVL
jgi:multidrug efflux pump subunit AcrB